MSEQATNSGAARVTGTSLVISRTLPASPERVWEYWVNPELRQKWFCAGETGTAPGEPFVMDFDHTRISDSAPPEDIECGNEPIQMRGEIVEFDPPHKLVYNWPDDKGPDTVVTVKLTPTDSGTLLELTHERLSSKEFRKGASAGWHAHLDLLLDLTSEQPARDFWLHYAGLKAGYDKS